ncbi:MAG TPA: GNAT family N-acetyltransferase [Actinomycetota bacterium]|jgi:GNAT superfamily N-acetyltransferase|nr:GNAT family N-acetyltransferase [Actinomycetota bacterium]
MTDIEVRAGENPELDKRLGDGLYEFNSTTTGIYDGELFSASVEDESGEIVAGVTGHTWGGHCEVSRLWVHESRRGRGVGRRLMEAVEREAIRRGCTQIGLSTHSFQAPLFYEGLGFKRIGTMPNCPTGHEQYFYLKSLVS